MNLIVSGNMEIRGKQNSLLPSGPVMKYLLLTEFEGRTVSYGPSFFRLYSPSAKRAGHKSKGKKRGSVTYSTDQENEVSKIFIISVRPLLCV